MNKPFRLLTPTARVEVWVVESSHMPGVPEKVEAKTLGSLRRKVQAIADTKPYRKGVPPMGQIQFRYETDEEDYVTVVHCYFINKHGDQRRFMKLKREDQDV